MYCKKWLGQHPSGKGSIESDPGLSFSVSGVCLGEHSQQDIFATEGIKNKKSNKQAKRNATVLHCKGTNINVS